MQGENFQIDKEPLLLIPLIKSDLESEFISLLDELLLLSKNNKDYTQIQLKIDVLVFKLYGLNFEEAQMIDETIQLDYFQFNRTSSIVKFKVL